METFLNQMIAIGAIAGAFMVIALLAMAIVYIADRITNDKVTEKIENLFKEEEDEDSLT